MPDEFVTVAEIAERFKINQQTVRNWIDQDELPACGSAERFWRDSTEGRFLPSDG